jgi:hypothetical protein
MNSPKIGVLKLPRLALGLLLSLASLLPAAWAQTVATPTFLPVAGTSLTKFSVVVTCPTVGTTLRNLRRFDRPVNLGEIGSISMKLEAHEYGSSNKSTSERIDSHRDS